MSLYKKIKNPYVAHYNKWFKNNGGPWLVSKRWVFDGKVRFDYICSTTLKTTAQLIAKAMNDSLELQEESDQKLKLKDVKPEAKKKSKTKAQLNFDFIEE